ncbi:MAG: putative 2-dehydropantoate 2-reductase [Bacteroidota bacterium]|nr:putative 2-dehydropantoate 2-reductase [Bacteroidota bacterium]MDP4205322.1 putative 2-dehydropantoate 2-reductase [Bacteroidota bacterium]
MSLRYAVVGPGALGGFYGGMLAHSGQEVHFLFNSDYKFVKENGLKVDSIYGDFHLHNVLAYNKAETMPACDVVLVCLKTIRNGLLKNIIPAITHKDSLVILIQNGLGVEEDVSKQFPNLNIAGGLAFICSNKIGPGHIAHLDYGKLNLGVYRMNDPAILQKVCDDFNRAGVPTEYSSDLIKSRWQKLVWNIPFNGMTVVMNATTDQLIQNKDIRQLVYDMMLEVVTAANHCGVALKVDYAHNMIDLTEKMTSYAPSMRLDYDNKRPMEIEYIYSRPVHEAKKAGFDMKKVAMLEKQLRYIQTTY